MAKIKHIALSTQDPEKTAAFYKETLGLEEVGKVDSPLAEGYYLTDGSINVAILKFKNDQAADKPEGVDFVGLHHFGFKVEDLEATEARLEAAHADKRPQINMSTTQARASQLRSKVSWTRRRHLRHFQHRMGWDLGRLVSGWGVCFPHA